MHKFRFSLIALLALAVFVLVLSGCGRRGLINVNGEKISKDEFYQRLEMVPVQKVEGGRVVAVPAGQYVMEQMIQEKLVQQLAKKEGVTPTDAQLSKKLTYAKKAAAGAFRQQLAQQGMSEEDWKKQQAIKQSAVNLMSKGITVTDAEALAAYNQIQKAPSSPFKRPAAVRISVILDKDQAKAEKAYKLLQSGQEFSSVAMQLSEDKNTAPAGGQVGWLSMDMNNVPMAVRTTAFSLDVDKYSSPVHVQSDKDSAWMILKVDAKRPAHVDSFNDVKDIIREEVAVQKGARTSNFAKSMQEFIRDANITINAERYKGIPKMMKDNASAVLTQMQSLPGGNKPSAAGTTPGK